MDESYTSIIESSHEIQISQLPAASKKRKFNSNSLNLSAKGYVSFTRDEYRKGRWTNEEHLRYLLASSLSDGNWSSIVRSLKTRSEAQIRSHKQKMEMAMKKPGNKKLQEDTCRFLHEKLHVAQENLRRKKIPKGTLTTTMKKSLYEEFKQILGPRMNQDYIITKEDVEFVGIKLLKAEYDTLFEDKHIKEGKNFPMQMVSSFKAEGESLLDIGVESLDDNNPTEKNHALDSIESQLGSSTGLARTPFTIFSNESLDY